MPDTVRCAKVACPIASGGRCLEGFADPADECPHYGLDNQDESEDAVADVAPAGASQSFLAGGRPDGGAPTGARDSTPIHAGADLSTTEAAEIARRALARVVVVAGVEESGKTSLVTCAFHHLLEGPFAGYAFAGSRTLPAFDERSHRARLESGRSAPTMGRTSSAAGTRFLHLRLAREADPRDGIVAAPRDLLLTDVSGEAFRRARDSAADARELPILQRADRLAILVDGAKLAQPGERQGAWRNAASLLGSLLDAGMVDGSTAVDFVVTKWDLVVAAERADDAVAFVAALEERAATFAARLAEVRWHRVAALPTRAGVPLGFGVDALVRGWMEDSFLVPSPAAQALAAGMSAEPTSAGAPTVREYARFGARHFRSGGAFASASRVGGGP